MEKHCENQGLKRPKRESEEVLPTSHCENQGLKRPKRESEEVLPIELRDKFKPLRCDLCNVTTSSTVTAYTHYEGKAHLKNVNAYMRKHHNIESAFKKQKVCYEPKRCEVCDIQLTSLIVYQQHIAGKQHRKNLKKNYISPVTISTKVEVDPTGRFGIGQSFVVNETVEPDPKVFTAIPSFFCDICKISTNNEQQLVIHKLGQKHLKKLKKNEMNLGSNSIDSSEYYNEKDVWMATPKKEEN